MRHRLAALTLPEVIAIVAVLLILCALAPPHIAYGLQRSEMTRSLSNMKQLHLVTRQMTLDNATTGDTNLGWPGDHGGFSNWATQLVPAYLKTNDFAILLSAPAKIVNPKALPLANTNRILLYAVTSNSPVSTILLSTANFTNTPAGGLPPKHNAIPYGDRGFVIFDKGGSGAILQARQAGQVDVIGAYAPLCP